MLTDWGGEGHLYSRFIRDEKHWVLAIYVVVKEEWRILLKYQPRKVPNPDHRVIICFSRVIRLVFILLISYVDPILIVPLKKNPTYVLKND